MSNEPAATSAASVGAVAELYLGNLLYALEMTALTLEQQESGAEGAAFYRGIARKLAEAHAAGAAAPAVGTASAERPDR